MLMPPKGVYTMLPLNAEARAVADAWTQERDAGNECRGYGAATIMRVPGRLHIHWADDALLDFIKKVQTQGISVASPVCATACASRKLSHYTT